MNIFITALSVIVGGILGTSVDNSYSGRLSQFISGPESAPVKLFAPENAATGGWRGEHAGKWLYAASHAYGRTGDKALLARIESVADYLVSLQQENGYLGCYKEENRFCFIPSDGSFKTGWDLWNCCYLVKGFTELYKVSGQKKYLDAACRIADLMYDTFIVKGRKIANTGGHCGLVGTGTIDPLCDLYRVKPDVKYKELISRCIEEMDSTPGLGLVKKASAGIDVSLIGNGKIYEMLRNFTGLAKAYSIFRDQKMLDACLGAWNNITEHHLTPLGGPWGGIGVFKEVFNRECSFAPYQITETCSVMDWMHFNAELLDITGDARYANEIEKTAYNSLMAARAEDGIRWIYYLDTNGEYGPGDEWSCCWSSGMIALEDLCDMLWSVKGKTVYANVISPSKAELTLSGGRKVAVSQTEEYVFDGKAEFVIGSDASFTLAIPDPYWAPSWNLSLNGKPLKAKLRNGYLEVRRGWKNGDRLKVEFPCETRHVEEIKEYQDEGSCPPSYLGRATSYFCFAKGPLVYACEHPDLLKKQDPVVMERSGAEAVNISDRQFSVGADIFRPICLMPPYSSHPYRSIWVEIEN